MRVVYMGTPVPAARILDRVSARHEVSAVYTQPARPAGRGRKPSPSPVRTMAESHGLPVVEPQTMRTEEAVAQLAALDPELVVVVAFGHILPQAVLDVPRLGCVNVHFSLLPRWRGAAPVERAIMAGDGQTGVTTMLMDAGMDTGPILQQATEPIEPDDTGATLLERLTVLGAHLLDQTLDAIASGSATPRPQPDDGVTYAPKLTADDLVLRLDAAPAAADQVRALAGGLGVHAGFRDRRLKVWAAAATASDRQVDDEPPPGTITSADADGLECATGRGVLRLLEVQPEGKRRMDAADFVRGYRPAAGERLLGRDVV